MCICSPLPTPPPVPPFASLDANIGLAEATYRYFVNEVPWGNAGSNADLAFLTNFWLYEMVNTGAPWDYKQWGQQYVPFGNFNFGAVCAALGNTQAFCQSGAGLALIGRYWLLSLAANEGIGPYPQYGGAGTPFLAYPFGDQPGDSSMIANGYYYYQMSQRCPR